MNLKKTALASLWISFLPRVVISQDAGPASVAVPAEVQPATQPEILIIAHRGASGYLPEHTLESYALAYGMGADYIEQDVVLTKDDQAVVLHDIHLDTVTDVATKFPGRNRKDGRYYAIDFTLKEIKQLAVHERLNHKNLKPVFDGRFPARKSSFQIPTLAEAIELIQGLNQSSGKSIGIYPEIKKPRWHRDQGKDISPIVVKVLQNYGYHDENDHVFLQCFDPNELRRIRKELNCQMRLVQLIGSNDWNEAAVDYDTMVTEDGIKQIAQYANGIGPWMPYVVSQDNEGKLVTSNLVAIAHDNELVVHPFTFRADSLPKYARDFKTLVQTFEKANVDGLFTDHTDKAKRALLNSQSK